MGDLITSPFRSARTRLMTLRMGGGVGQRGSRVSAAASRVAAAAAATAAAGHAAAACEHPSTAIMWTLGLSYLATTLGASGPQCSWQV